MKKTTTLLCITTFICTSIKSMEMDVENNNNSSSNTPESHNTRNKKSKNSNSLEKLLEQNNILLHTLIMQNKIHFEYEDDKKYTTNVTINQHAKNTQTALNNLYKSTNAQLTDKTLHIPMTGQTTVPKTKDKNTKDIL
jgi:hypothetical protein